MSLDSVTTVVYVRFSQHDLGRSQTIKHFDDYYAQLIRSAIGSDKVLTQPKIEDFEQEYRDRMARVKRVCKGKGSLLMMSIKFLNNNHIISGNSLEQFSSLRF